MSDIGIMVKDDFVDEDFFFDKSEEEKKTDHKFHIIKIIFAVLCLILAGELVYYKYIMPSFSSPKVTVSGQQIYSAEEIAVKLLPMNSTNWFDFNVDQAVSILSSEPGIENVTVEKKFPDKIFVNVVEREPVALTFVVDEGKSLAIQIDKNGVLFPGKSNELMNINSIPIISGLPVEHMSQGMRIPSKYRPLIDQIYKIRELSQNYFAGVSEICVLDKESGNYELALIPANSKIRVLTDRALNEDALKYMMVVLDVVNLLDTDVSEVDLRYGSVSCRSK